MRRVLIVVAMLLASVPPAHAAPPDSPACKSLAATGYTSRIVGTSGDDILNGTTGDDLIIGGLGNDVIHGLTGNDLLCGGSGTDEVYGDEGSAR